MQTNCPNAAPHWLVGGCYNCAKEIYIANQIGGLLDCSGRLMTPSFGKQTLNPRAVAFINALFSRRVGSWPMGWVGRYGVKVSSRNGISDYAE